MDVLMEEERRYEEKERYKETLNLHENIIKLANSVAKFYRNRKLKSLEEDQKAKRQKIDASTS